MSNQPSQVCNDFLKDPNITGVYSIFDVKLKKFFPPFLSTTESEAVRNFTNLVNYSDSLVCKFPHDYQLYLLCYFDVSTGAFNYSDGDFRVICTGNDVIKSDTIKYKKLKDQIQTVQSQVGAMIADFDKAKASLDDHIRSYMRLKDEHPYATVDINLNDKQDINGSSKRVYVPECPEANCHLAKVGKSGEVELFPVPPKKPKKRSFVSKILDYLFS